MLSIERMRVRLPQGYEHRAADIAREVGQLLAGVDSPSPRSTDSLSVPSVRVRPDGTNGEVARAIAEAISAGLRRLR